MRKEIIFAILAGAIFGLVIAFGIWKANSSMKSNKTQGDEVAQNVNSPNNNVSSGDFNITLIKPETNTVISNSTTTVSGITKPDVWVTISSEEDDYIIKTGNDGSFEEDVELIAGVNEIIVTGIDEETHESVSEKFLVVYSTEFSKSDEEAQDEEVESE